MIMSEPGQPRRNDFLPRMTRIALMLKATAPFDFAQDLTAAKGFFPPPVSADGYDAAARNTPAFAEASEDRRKARTG